MCNTSGLSWLAGRMPRLLKVYDTAQGLQERAVVPEAGTFTLHPPLCLLHTMSPYCVCPSMMFLDAHLSSNNSPPVTQLTQLDSTPRLA